MEIKYRELMLLDLSRCEELIAKVFLDRLAVGCSAWLSLLQRRSLNRDVLDSNPTDAVSNIGT